MNLLKALETLSPQKPAGGDGNKTSVAENNSSPSFEKQTPKSPEPQTEEMPNMLASVLERHEAISNRVRKNKQ